VEIPSVYFELLPGKIGYILMLQFGENSADEFIAALDDLEKQEMGGLIVDLRSNPGGRLDIAIRITDQFVAGDLPIVTQKGAREGAVRELSTPPDDYARSPYPMVVLINERSASASEIVAGALQDYGRATLVGKRTYGKGSVQRLIPLSTEAEKYIGGDSQLRLTVQYYFLPLGRCIHTVRNEDGAVVQEGGVEPDVAVDAEQIPLWRLEERARLQVHAEVLDYVHKHAAEIQRLFADGDDRDPSRYPEFEKLYKAVSSSAPREDLRSVLRHQARRQLEDLKGREFACDFQEDVQLQRAILEILKKLGESPADHPRYKSLVDGQ
jgi:C-terminal processing protease CtpA/Prc